MLPHARSLNMPDDDALEEERRLCYVGMTRAQRHLTLSCATYRGRYGAGSEQPMVPSRFLQEIPAELVDEVSQRSMWHDGTRIYEGTSATLVSDPVTVSRSSQTTLNDAGVETHNSVEAIQGFFKQRAASSDVAAISDRPTLRSEVAAVPPSSSAVQPMRRKSETPTQEGRFARGAKVRHQRFGIGIVQQCQGQGERAKLSVYFHRHGLKTLIAGPAKLQAL